MTRQPPRLTDDRDWVGALAMALEQAYPRHRLLGQLDCVAGGAAGAAPSTVRDAAEASSPVGAGGVTITYEFRMTALCPEGDVRDHYDVTLARDEMLTVRGVELAAAAFVNQRIYQEDLTVELARRLGGSVTTVGWHSGVKVTCRA